jgi:hypothetical protein
MMNNGAHDSARHFYFLNFNFNWARRPRARGFGNGYVLKVNAGLRAQFWSGNVPAFCLDIVTTHRSRYRWRRPRCSHSPVT